MNGGPGALSALWQQVSRGGVPQEAQARLVWISGLLLLLELAVLVATLVGVAVVLLLILPLQLVRGVHEGVMAAEAGKTRMIRAQAEAELAAADARKSSRKVVAPRLTVLRVDTAIWRETVALFAERSEAVLIDVSVVTENVLWKIERAQERWRSKTVFVGRYDLVLALAQ